MSDIEHLDEGEGSEPSDAIEIEYSDEDELSEEGEKLDTYEKDDFLVADDELSDSEQQSRPKKTKRLKSARDMEQQKAEVEEELKDLVDSELEDEDAEPLPTKHAAIEPTSDASDADEELDSDVEHDRANLALVSQIFAIDVEEETPASPEKSMLRHFEHAQLKEIYATEEQKQVRRKDIPERLQVIFKGREFPDKTELDQEAEWLFSRIVLHSSSLDRPEVKTKIRHFLDCYRVSKYEIPFIGTYRKHFFEPDLKVSWLRDLARWDMDWGFVYGSKLKQATLLTKMQEAGVDIPEEINILLGTTHPTDFRHEISDLDAFIDNFAPPGSMDTAFKKSSMFKTQSFDQIRQRYGRIAEEAALSPFELNFNVKMNERRYTPGICLQRPTELAFEYIDKPDEEGRILDDVANMMRQDLHSMPSIRRDVRDEYLKRAKVFTTPTEKGKIMLDIFHPLYRTKNLELGKPVTSFDDDLWILIESAEQQSLITVSFRVVNESQTDDILEKLKEVYLSDETEEDEVIHEWNAYRTEILFHLVRQLYSTLEKHLRSEFHIKAEQYIAEKCASKFERLLKHVPFTSEEEEEQRPRVLAFVTDTEVESFGQTVMIALNSYGEVVDSKTLGFLSMRRTENRATIDQRKFEEDKTIIQRTALEFRPNLIVVGANCLAATIVRINLQRDIIKQITQDGFREDQVSFTLDSAN